MPGTLFVVATPIGNLQDMTFRAVETISRASYICCEDTRVTKKLIDHYKITTPLKRLDAHATPRQFTEVLADLQAGKDIAVVTDAGTPGISDPGAHLIEYILKHEPGAMIVPVPGASAVPAALSILGAPFNQYTFYGFPPTKKGREKFFKIVASNEGAVVLYESVHRIEKTLRALEQHIGERPIMLARELTKQYESVYRGTISKIVANDFTKKGEFVIVVTPLQK